MMGLLFREGAYLFISSPLANVIESFSLLVTLFYVTAHSLEIPTLRRTAAVSLIAVSMALTAGYEFNLPTVKSVSGSGFVYHVSLAFAPISARLTPPQQAKLEPLGGKRGGPGRCHH